MCEQSISFSINSLKLFTNVLCLSIRIVEGLIFPMNTNEVVEASSKAIPLLFCLHSCYIYLLHNIWKININFLFGLKQLQHIENINFLKFPLENILQMFCNY